MSNIKWKVLHPIFITKIIDRIINYLSIYKMDIPIEIKQKILDGKFKATIENWVYTIKEPIPTFHFVLGER
jgi:hypothetical protein